MSLNSDSAYRSESDLAFSNSGTASRRTAENSRTSLTTSDIGQRLELEIQNLSRLASIPVSTPP